ncbi:TRAM domain-containing protein [Escherichia coli]
MDEDFEATMKLIQDVGFDMSFSFIFSPRPGTRRPSTADDVDMEVKKEPVWPACSTYHQQPRPCRLAVPDAGHHPAHPGGRAFKLDPMEPVGRTENNRVVNFEGQHTLIGGFADVEITEVCLELPARQVHPRRERDEPADRHRPERNGRRPDNVPDELGVAAFIPINLPLQTIRPTNGEQPLQETRIYLSPDTSRP